MAGKFEIKKAKNGEFYFNLKAGNGQIILTSEMYKAKSGANNGIESVMKNAPEITLYEKKESAGGKFSFNLKAKNKQVIGTSQSYTSESARDNGIDSVMKNAPEATINDIS